MFEAIIIIAIVLALGATIYVNRVHVAAEIASLEARGKADLQKLKDDIKPPAPAETPSVTGDHVVGAVQAVGNAIAQVVGAMPTPAPVPVLLTPAPAAPAPDAPTMTDQERANANFLAGGVGAPANGAQAATPPSAPVTVTIDPRVLYYDHNNFVSADGPYSTEPLKVGANTARLTYTSQEPGKVAPTQAWMSEDGGATWQGPAMAQAEAVFTLAASPAVQPLLFKFDTDGRMQGQLRNF